MTRRYLVAIIILAAAMRLIALGKVEFWYDEAFTVLVSRLPWDRMIQATAGDTHPPLFYMLMWGWLRLFGSSEFSVRLVSVLASLSALPLVWRVMLRLKLSDTARLAVLALMAIGPFELYFAQEARMYAILQLFYLAGVVAVLERRYWLLCVINAGLLYLHNYGLFYVPTLVVLALYLDRRLTPQLTLATLIPIIAYMPWLAMLIGQINVVQSGYWIEPVTLGQIIYTVTIFFFGPFTRQYVLAAALVAIGLICYSLIRMTEDRRSAWVTGPGLVIAWLAFAPLAAAVLTSVAVLPVYLFRGLIGCAPFLYMIATYPMAALPVAKRLYAAALILPILATGIVGYWLDIHGFKSSTAEIVRQIQAEWREGDILYATNDGNWVMFTLYQDQPVYLMPQCGAHDRGALSRLTREALDIPIADLDDIPHTRAWLLWNWGAPTSQCNRQRAADLVGQRDPWYLVSDTDLMTSGVWLISE